MLRATFQAFIGCFVAAFGLAGCSQASEPGDPADGFDVSFTGGKADDGSGRLPGALADCASPLMRAIYDGASPYVTRGNVPPELFATEKNFGHLTMLRDGPEIFPAMGELIEAAESEVVFQTYVWERGSVAAKII